MAKNVVRDAGFPIYGTTKNIASAKVSGALIPFPSDAPDVNTSGVALLTADAASGADGVPCILGGVVVRYAALSTDTAVPGTKLYFDGGNDRLTTLATTNEYAGRAAKTKINGDTTADVYLNMP
jgi:hypothetical protein